MSQPKKASAKEVASPEFEALAGWVEDRDGTVTILAVALHEQKIIRFRIPLPVALALSSGLELAYLKATGGAA